MYLEFTIQIFFPLREKKDMYLYLIIWKCGFVCEMLAIFKLFDNLYVLCSINL